MVSLIRKALAQYAKDARVEGLNPNAISLDGVYPLEADGRNAAYTGVRVRIEGHLTITQNNRDEFVIFNREYQVNKDGATACPFMDRPLNEAIYRHR